MGVVFSVEELKRAWFAASRDAGNDFVFDVIRYDDVRYNLDNVLQRLARELAGGLYKPSPLMIVEVPKSTYTVRPGAVIPFTDLVVLYAVLLRVAPALDKNLSPSVFSYRFPPGQFIRTEEEEGVGPPVDYAGGGDATPYGTPLTPTPWFEGWARYHQQSLAAAKRYAFCAAGDVTAFFENTPTRVLCDRLAELAGPRYADDLAFLKYLFDIWGWTAGRGPTDSLLPQGNDVSLFLSNFYLMDLDAAMEELAGGDASRYMRYVDDFRFFTDDEEEGHKALLLADSILRRNRLSLQTVKTAVTPSAGVFDWEVERWLEGMSDLAADPLRTARDFITTEYHPRDAERWERVYQRALSCFGAAGDDGAVEPALDTFLSHPNYKLLLKNLAYLRGFAHARPLGRRLAERLEETTFTFPFHRMYLYRLAAYARDDERRLRAAALREATSADAPWYVKVAAYYCLNTFALTEDELRLVDARVENEPHPWVTRAALVTLRQRPGDQASSARDNLLFAVTPGQEQLREYFQRAANDESTARAILKALNEVKPDTPGFIETLYQLDLLKENPAVRPALRDYLDRLLAEPQSLGKRLEDRLATLRRYLDDTLRGLWDKTRGVASEYLESLLRDASEAVVTADMAGRIKIWNRGATALFGYDSAEVVNKRLEQLSELPFGCRTFKELLGVLKDMGGWLFFDEMPQRTKAGRVITVSATYSLITDGAGDAVGVSVISRDVSEARRVEKACDFQLASGQLLTEISAVLIAPGDLDATVEHVLGKTAALLNVTRASASRFVELVSDIRRLWVGYPSPAAEGEAETVDMGRSQWWAASLKANRVVIVEDARLLTREDRDILNAAGVRSLVAVPVFIRGQWGGYVVCEDTARIRRWEPEEVNFLLSVSALIAKALERKESDEALRASEARYRALFEKNVNPIWVTDGIGNFLDANDAALAFFEADRSALGARNVRDFIPADLLDEVLSEIIPLWARGGVARELPFLVGGARKYVNLTVTPTEWQGKRVVFGVGQDITEQKRSQEALREATSKLLTLIENIPDCVYFKDLAGLTVIVNKAFEELTGIRLDRLVGRRAEDLLSPELAALVAAGDDAVLGQKRPLTFEQRLPRGEDEIIFETSKFPLYDGRGTVIGVAAVSRDITARKRSEETVRELERRYRQIVESSVVGIALHELDGDLLYCNPALLRIFGVESFEDLVSRPFASYWTPETVELEAEMRRRRIAGEPPLPEPLQFTAVRPDGERRAVEVWQRPFGDPAGNIKQTLFLDVTDRKRMEERLRASEALNRAVVESSPVGISVRSRTGRLLSVNEAWRRIWGHSPEEVAELMAAQPPTLSFDERDAYLGPYLAAVREVYTRGGQLFIPNLPTGRKGEGKAEWISHYFYAIPGGGGEVDRVVILTEDVTSRKKAEEELAAREAYYRSLFENTGTATLLVDPDDTVILANQVFLTLVGKEKGEVEGRRRWVEFVAEPGGLAAIASDGGSSGGVASAEIRMRDGLGAVRVVIANAAPIPGTGQRVISLLDVTALKELEARDRYLASILESSPDAIYSVNTDRIFVSWNKGAERLLGYKAEEILGKPGETVVPPECRGEMTRLINEKLRRGMRVEAFDTQRLTKDGRLVDVSFLAAPIYDERGEIVGYSGIARDISARKAAERLVFESEEKYRTLYENVPVGVCRIALGGGGRVISANPALVSILGYDNPRQLEGIADTSLFADGQERKGLYEELVNEGAVAQREVRLRRRDGTAFWGEVSARLLADAAGAKYVDAVVDDISDRKQAEEALERQNLSTRALFEIAAASNRPTDLPTMLAEVSAVLADNENVLAGGLYLFDGSGTHLLLETSFGPHGEYYRLEPVIGRAEGFGAVVVNASSPVRREGFLLANIRGKRNGEGDFAVECGVGLRSGGTTLGTLQMLLRWADEKTIAFLELAGEEIGSGIKRRLAEAELQRSEALTRAAFDAASDLVWVMDREGTTQLANQAAVERWEKEAETVVGSNLDELFPASVVRRIMGAMREAIASGNEIRQELHWKGKYYETKLLPLYDEEGEVDRFVCFWRDVTLVKTAAVTTDAYRGIAEALGGVASWEGTFEIIVKNVISAAGVGAAAAYVAAPDGKGYQLYCAAGFSKGFKEDAARYDDGTELARAVRGGEPLYFVTPGREYLGRDVRDVREFNYWSVLPVRMGEEVPCFLLAAGAEDPRSSPLLRDTLEACAVLAGNVLGRLAAREESEKSDRLYRTLVETSSDVVLTLAEDGAVRYLSPRAAEAFGWRTRGGDVITYFIEWVALQDRRRFADDIKGVWEGRALREGRYKLLRPGGEAFDAEVNAAAIPGGIKTGGAVVVSVRDITPRLAADEELKSWARDLESLNTFAVELSGAKKGDDIFGWIARRLRDITGALWVSVGELDEQERCIRIKEVAAPRPYLEKAAKIIGVPFKHLKFPVAEETASRILAHKAEKLGGIHEVSLGAIPPAVARKLEQLFHVGSVYGAVLQRGGKIWGTAVIIMPEGARELSLQTLKVFGDIASGAIQRIRQEEEGLETERRYQALFERSPVGIYRITPQGLFLEANAALIRMLGYDSFEQLARQDPAVYGGAPYDREAFFREVELTGEVRGREAAWTTRDNRTIMVRESARVVRGTDGRVLYYEGTVEDITESRGAGSAAATSEQWCRAFLDRLPQLILTYDAAARAVTFVNRGVGVLGVGPGEIINSSLEGFAGRFVIEEDRPAFLGACREAIDTAGGEGPAGAVFRLRAAAGHEVPMRLELCRSYDVASPGPGLILALRDLTEIQRWQEQAAAEINEHRTRFAEAAAALMVLDKGGVIQDVNEAWVALTGYERDDVLGKEFALLVEEGAAPGFKEEWAQTVADGVDYEGELTIRCKAGSKVPCAVVGNVVKNMTRTTPSVHCALRDLTAQVRTTTALRRRIEELSLLNAVAGKLASRLAAGGAYDAVSQTLREASRARSTIVATYDAENGEMKIVSLATSQENQALMARVLGHELSALRLQMPPGVAARLLAEGVFRRHDLVALTRGVVGGVLAQALQSEVGGGVYYVIGLRDGDELIGLCFAAVEGGRPELSLGFYREFASLAVASIKAWRREQFLSSQQEGLWRLLKQAPVAVFATSEGREGIILRANEYMATLLGIEGTAEVLGQKLADWIEGAEVIGGIIDAVRNDAEEVGTWEVRCRRRDGRTFDARLTARGTFGEDGRFKGMEGVLKPLSS